VAIVNNSQRSSRIVINRKTLCDSNNFLYAGAMRRGDTRLYIIFAVALIGWCAVFSFASAAVIDDIAAQRRRDDYKINARKHEKANCDPEIA
jgi:hypothetical protein